MRTFILAATLALVQGTTLQTQTQAQGWMNVGTERRHMYELLPGFNYHNVRGAKEFTLYFENEADMLRDQNGKIPHNCIACQSGKPKESRVWRCNPYVKDGKAYPP